MCTSVYIKKHFLFQKSTFRGAFQTDTLCQLFCASKRNMLLNKIFLRSRRISDFVRTYFKNGHSSRVSNIESDNSQNVGLEDYNNISDRIFPHFTTPSIKICLG